MTKLESLSQNLNNEARISLRKVFQKNLILLFKLCQNLVFENSEKYGFSTISGGASYGISREIDGKYF